METKLHFAVLPMARLATVNTWSHFESRLSTGN